MKKPAALNYTTHALEDLQALCSDYRRAGLTNTLQVVTQLTDLMREAVKFNLPPHGDLVALDKLDEAFSEFVRLPFDAVCLEAPFPSVDNVYQGKDNFQESLSTRRIAVAWTQDMHKKYSLLCRYGPRKGFYVTSVYYSDSRARWMHTAMANFIPENPGITRGAVESTTEYGQAEFAHLLERGLVKETSSTYECHTAILLPELAGLLAQRMGSETDALTRLSMDLRDESATAIGFCLTINSSNVLRAPLDAPAKLNKKRLANGKPPFYEAWVLELHRKASVKGSHDDGFGGSSGRLSPRMHLRRGHIRRLAPDKVVYVRSAVVGHPSQGTVDKTYRLT